ncbi:hypothetical protein OY671_011719, partial [Metschnikowia pulcherrima]
REVQEHRAGAGDRPDVRRRAERAGRVPCLSPQHPAEHAGSDAGRFLRLFAGAATGGGGHVADERADAAGAARGRGAGVSVVLHAVSGARRGRDDPDAADRDGQDHDAAAVCGGRPRHDRRRVHHRAGRLLRSGGSSFGREIPDRDGGLWHAGRQRSLPQ